MNHSLSQADWELLSAYLDEALDERRRAALKARLESDASLQEALARLQRTRALLRRAPQRRAPRSFALRPEMVRAKAAGSLRWPLSMGWVSALATLLLAVVLVSDFARFGFPVALLPGAAAPAPVADAMEEPQALMAPEAAAQGAPTEGEANNEALESSPASGEASPLPTPGGEELGFAAGESGKAPPEEATRSVQVETPGQHTLWRVAEFGLALLALGSGWSARRRKRRTR